MNVFLNPDESIDYPITYIEWDNDDMDTVKCHYDIGDCHMVLNKVWYNDVDITEKVTGGKYYTVIKEIGL